MNSLTHKFNWKIILSAVIFFCILLFFHFRGITYYDEGYILNAALRTAHGEIPYKNFDMVYTPLSFVITSGFLKIFGESVFAARIAAFVISAFSLYAIFLILKLFTKNNLLILGTLLFFVSWGPSHINFTWPTMFAICFLFYSAYFFICGLLKQSNKLLFISGVMSVLIFLSKQNFGIGILIVLSLSFLYFPEKKKLLLHYFFGVLASTCVFIIILLFTNSFIPFIQNMYVYTFMRVILDKALDTPFLYEGSIFIRFTKLIFYTLPINIAVYAFLKTFKRNKIFSILPVIIATFYLLGVRPTTDYVHIVPLLAITSIPLAMIITYVQKGSLKIGFTALMVFMIVLGFYTAIFKGYHQWEPALKDTTVYGSDERLQIYLSPQQKNSADILKSYILQNAKDSEYIFVNYYSPMVYFLTDKKNPTPYDLVNFNLPFSYQSQIVQTLQERDIKIVVMHELNKNENTLITAYVRKHYRVDKGIDGFLLMRKVQ